MVAYTLLGVADTNSPSAISSTATVGLSNAIALELSTALPDVTLVFPSRGFATSVEQKLTQVSVDSTNIDTEESHSGGAVGIMILIGSVIGAIAIVSLIGAVAYRQWSRRQIPIGNANVVHRVHGQTIANTDNYVDHVVGHQIADVDAFLSETSTDSILARSPVGFNSTSKEINADNEENLCAYGIKDTACVEGASPGLERSFSDVTTSTCVTDNPAPSA